jgi:hypothetical protein
MQTVVGMQIAQMQAVNLILNGHPDQVQMV